MIPSFHKDNYIDYYVVMESDVLEPEKPEILKCEESSNGDLHFIRFRTTLQSVGKRNRNKRLWEKPILSTMLADECVQEMISKHSWAGEAGHPTAESGKISMERIFQINPEKISHYVLDYNWEGNLLKGTIETIDDINGPGAKLMRRVLQGEEPAFSFRSVVPQKVNRDGSIDVIGPGRAICYDNVIMPSHYEAYIDKNQDIQNVTKKLNGPRVKAVNESIQVSNIATAIQYNAAMEAFTDFVLNSSDKVNKILDTATEVAVESATINKKGIMTVSTNNGIYCISPELKYRKELNDLMRNF